MKSGVKCPTKGADGGNIKKAEVIAKAREAAVVTEEEDTTEAPGQDRGREEEQTEGDTDSDNLDDSDSDCDSSDEESDSESEELTDECIQRLVEKQKAAIEAQQQALADLTAARAAMAA